MTGRWILLIVLTVAACDQGTLPTKGPDCAATSNALVAAIAETKDLVAGPDAMSVQPTLVGLCRTAAWSAEARSCMVHATTAALQYACWHQHLTTEQARAIFTASMPLGVAAAIWKLRFFADRTCACKDHPCTVAVSDEMARWSQEIQKYTTDLQPPPKLTDAQMKQLTDSVERMTTCTNKVAPIDPAAAPPVDPLPSP